MSILQEQPISNTQYTVQEYQRKPQRLSHPPDSNEIQEQEKEGKAQQQQWIDDTATKKRGIWYFGAYHPIKLSQFTSDEYSKILHLLQQPYIRNDTNNNNGDDNKGFTVHTRKGDSYSLLYPLPP